MTDSQRMRLESFCVEYGASEDACLRGPYSGGPAGDGTLHVSDGLQDVEGNEAHLVEAVATLPPALG